MIHYDTLLQNGTDIITESDSYFITKCDKILLQNASGFLLQNVTVVLQNATVFTNWDDFITKCNSYYKMRYFSQIATVQVLWSAYLWNDAFVMKKHKSFRKRLKFKAPKTDTSGTPEISSKKVLYTLLIWTDCFLFSRYE